MKISKSLLPAAALVALFAGCQDEDFGYQSKDIKYQSEFKKAFGEIDPEQDWSMAMQVTAELTGAPEGVLEIFYKNPISADAVILARKTVVGGNVSVKFDMAKNVKRVFVRINAGNGFYPINGYFKVVDGMVDFGSTTRAEIPTGPSRVTKGTAFSVQSNVLNPAKKDQMELYKGDALLAADWIDGYYRNIPQTEYERQYQIWRGDVATDWYTKETFSNLIPLNDVLSSDDERPQIFFSDVAKFFVPIDGGKPLFTESENHVKYMKPGSTPQLEKDLVFTMDGDGPMYLDYFFKGTEFHNQFGYFYYTGSAPTPDQFKTMPKYILVDNMTTQSGKVRINETESKDWDLLQSVSFNASAQKDLIGGIDGINLADEGTWDNRILGTRFQLTYFGADGTGTPSYTFPDGTKIGLFIYGTIESGRSDNGTDGTIITSIADLNLKLYGDTPHAAAFRANGQTVFAMEDMLTGSDYDVNDVMFFVNGKFKEEIPDIEPPVDFKPETWIVACEDLGGAFDYDFNDLVFGIQKAEVKGEDGKTLEGVANLNIIPLAAGGTLTDKIMFNGVALDEIHTMLGAEGPAEDGLFEALNVAGGSSPAAGAPILVAEKIDNSISINTLMQMIQVNVTKIVDDEKEETESAAGSYNIGFNYDKKKENNTPQVLLLPQGWDWPAENVTITKVYPGFKDWAGDMTQLDWIANKVVGSNDLYVTNPIQPAAPVDPVDPDDPDPTPTPDPVVIEAWNITLVGSETINKGTKQTYTVTVEGVTDEETLKKLEFSSYSPGVADFVKADGKVVTTIADGKVTFEVEGKVVSVATICVKMPADETHRITRKELHVSVVKKDPKIVLSKTSFALEANKTDGFTISMEGNPNVTWSYSSSDESVAKITNWSGVYGATTITAYAKGTAEITVSYPGDDTWSAQEIKLTVKVGEAVWGETVDITSMLGEVVSTKDPWNGDIQKITVDMSSFNWTGILGAKLRITGSSDGQVCVTSSDFNNWPINRVVFSDGVIEGDISALTGSASFPIFSYGSTLTVTKLELVKKEISME